MPPETMETWSAVLSGYRDLPRLGRDNWTDIAAAHGGRHSPRPGESLQQVALMSACAVHQALELHEEITGPSLLEPGLGPWSAVHLPRWLAGGLPLSVREHLCRSAVELDQGLAVWPVPHPDSAAAAIVRTTLLRKVIWWGRYLDVAVNEGVASRALWVHRTPVAALWSPAARTELADRAALAARGLQCLSPDRWGDPGWAQDRAEGVAFRRRGPASKGANGAWRRIGVERWGSPARWSTASGGPAVRRARVRARLAGASFVPSGSAVSDVEDLTGLLHERRITPAMLRWQPVTTEPVRKTPVLVTGLEVDEQGQVLLLITWQESELAVSARAIVALCLAPTRGEKGLRALSRPR